MIEGIEGNKEENKEQSTADGIAIPGDFCVIKEKVFQVGDRVHVKCEGRKEPWQQGTITTVLQDGRYCINCGSEGGSMKLAQRFILLSREIDEPGSSPSQAKKPIKIDPPINISRANLPYTERDYRFLWDYYLLPVNRKDDELPSGMILRTKLVPCNLLRYKNSLFRKELYKKIKQLRRFGKEDEIYKMLKLLHDHDMSGRSGDGPSVLMNQILPSQEGADILISDGP